MIHGLDDSWNFVHEGNCSRDVVQYGDFTDLLPGIRDVLQQFHNSMWNIFQSTEMHTLIVSEFAVTHISMVLDNFTDVLRG
jgi:hypothetical protein